MGLDPTPWTHCAFLPGATVLRKGTLSDMGGGLMGEMEGGGGTKGRREKGVKGETLSDQIFAQCSAHSFIIFLSGCCSTHHILHHYCDVISDSIMEDNFGLLSVLLSCYVTICGVFNTVKCDHYRRQ